MAYMKDSSGRRLDSFEVADVAELSATIGTQVSTVVNDPAGPVVAKFNTEKATKAKLVNLVFDGDSLTWGHSSKGGQTYPRQTAEGIYATVYNFGVSGQGSSAMLADAVTQVDAVYEAGKQNFVLAMIGTNDILTGGAPSTTYNNIKAYHDGRRAAGFKTLAFTITPRTGGTDDAGHNTRRLAVNDLIRANWTTFADALVDVASDPIVGNLANTTNTTYFSDQTHFTNAGYAIIAKLARAELRKLGIDGMHEHYAYAPKRDSIFISAAAFTPRGTITSTLNNAVGVVPFWNMKDGVDEVVMASVDLPANWDFYRVELLWANAGAVAGDVRWGLTPYRLIVGANAALADTERPLIVTAGAQNILMNTVDFWTGSASQTIDKTALAQSFAVTRRGSNVGDTLAADARFYGIRVVNFTAIGPSLT
jgi:lysophospholipase L1-like esterase